MDCSKTLSIIGLIFNIVASIVLMWAYVFPKHFVDEDYIKEMGKKTGRFIQNKHIAERRNNLIGFLFFSIGFLFQLLGIIVP